jgi:hypothetical protein
MWLNDWIDEFEVRSLDDAARLGRDPRGWARLRELAERASADHWSSPLPDQDGSIAVAGRSLDLSGLLSCTAAGCLINQVESLLNQVWHYFDKVVVEGPSPGIFLERDEEYDYRLEQHVQLLLHLRDIGALPYLIFHDKPHAFCTHHFTESAKDGGLEFLLDSAYERRFKDAVVDTGRVERLPDGTGFTFSYSGRDHVTLVQWRNGGRHRVPSLRTLANREFSSHGMALVGDVALARSVGAPLVQGAQRYVPPQRNGRTAPHDVALELHLPVLRNVPAKELLRLRSEYSPELQRFRAALRTAIRQVASADPELSTKELAARVVQDHVEPELADIERRLLTARETLLKKSVLHIGVGATVATAGLLAAAPLVVAAGLTALGAAVKDATGYVDSAAELRLADMHFLWRIRNTHQGRPTRTRSRPRGKRRA